MSSYLVLLSLAFVALGLPASAHDGPPYPIVVDHAIAGCDLSIWADPDVGIGTFYAYVNASGTERPVDREIRLRVRPVSGRLPWAAHESEPSEEGSPYQRIAEVPFDARGAWVVVFEVSGPDGAEEFQLEVEVTPPGLGQLDLLWFLSPFLAVAFIWIKVVLKKREVEAS